MFIANADVEAEEPILWLPDAEGQFIGKNSQCWEGLKAKEEGGSRG